MELVSVTAEGVGMRERISGWDARLWSPMPVRTQVHGNRFEGEARLAFGALRLVRITADCHRIERSAEDQPTASGLVQLVVQRRGLSHITQFGRTAALKAGEWTICDADRSFVITSSNDSDKILLLLPRDRVVTASNDLCLHAARTFGTAGAGGTARLLPNYLSTLFEELGTVEESACGELVDMAAQLTRLALFEARRTAPTVTRRETLRLRVKDYIRRNLRDPSLSIDRVAEAFRCTKRHLHKVFSEDEITLNQFIWAERLDRCRETLGNPSLMRHSITEIAFMWGFNNSAHFSKAFKERFGLPPGIFRAHARAAAPTAGDLAPAIH